MSKDIYTCINGTCVDLGEISVITDVTNCTEPFPGPTRWCYSMILKSGTVQGVITDEKHHTYTSFINDNLNLKQAWKKWKEEQSSKGDTDTSYGGSGTILRT